MSSEPSLHALGRKGDNLHGVSSKRSMCALIIVVVEAMRMAFTAAAGYGLMV